MSTQPPEQNPNDYDEVTRLRLQLNHAEVQRDAFAAALKADVLKVVRVSIIQATIDADEEIARLQDELKMEKENEDRLVREWQKANNEVYGLKAQVAALIDDQTRLKAECQARQAENSVLAVECDSLKAEVERLTNDFPKMVAWGRGLEHDKRLLEEEVSRLKAEVEELGKKLAVADASTLLLKQDLRASKSSVEGLMAQLVELDDQKAENARMSKDEAYYEMRHKELIADKLRLGHQVRELADKLRKEG